MVIYCSKCKKKWAGRNEYACEIKMAKDPCFCEKELVKLSLEELRELCKGGK
jgi:hypothetical protein